MSQDDNVKRLIDFAQEVVDDLRETERLYPRYAAMLERGQAALEPFQEEDEE